jgi:hypothetical protein
LKKKFRRQSIRVSTPPRIGPITKAAAMIIERIPFARPSSPRGKASVMMIAEFAIRIEPATAWMTLKPVSWTISAERPQRSDPRVKRASPMR